MVSSLFQIFIGFSGLIGFLLRFIGPLTVAPTIALVGLSLFGVCSDYAGKPFTSTPINLTIYKFFCGGRGGGEKALEAGVWRV